MNPDSIPGKKKPNASIFQPPGNTVTLQHLPCVWKGAAVFFAYRTETDVIDRRRWESQCRIIRGLFSPQKLQSCGDPPPRLAAPQRRARSLDRRTSETFMTVSHRRRLPPCGSVRQPKLPNDCFLIDNASKSDLCLCLQPDLLNFKKGWMVKLEGTDQVNYCVFFFLNVNSCNLFIFLAKTILCFFCLL